MAETSDLFLAAHPYQQDVLALPVTDPDAAAAWYGRAFGMAEVERRSTPNPAVILDRDGVRIGFEINGGNPEQDGAAILVSDIHAARQMLDAAGAAPGEIKSEDRDGQTLSVFFVIAPDGLCYYFHQPVSADDQEA